MPLRGSRLSWSFVASRAKEARPSLNTSPRMGAPPPHSRDAVGCIASAEGDRPSNAWNSLRSPASLTKAPRAAAVNVWVPCCFTPREHMHICAHSATTYTPRASATSMRASAICCVRRSCICSRRAMASAMRASFERPRTALLPGRYPMCTMPKNGSRWCSQREWTLMSRTSTTPGAQDVALCASPVRKRAPPAMVRGSSLYPDVMESIAFAARAGVSIKPSRDGSSPIARRIVRYALTNCCSADVRGGACRDPRGISWSSHGGHTSAFRPASAMLGRVDCLRRWGLSELQPRRATRARAQAVCRPPSPFAANLTARS